MKALNSQAGLSQDGRSLVGDPCPPGYTTPGPFLIAEDGTLALQIWVSLVGHDRLIHKLSSDCVLAFEKCVESSLMLPVLCSEERFFQGPSSSLERNYREDF